MGRGPITILCTMVVGGAYGCCGDAGMEGAMKVGGSILWDQGFLGPLGGDLLMNHPTELKKPSPDSTFKYMQAH